MKYFQMLRYLYSYIPHLLSFLHCCNYSCWLLRCCYFLLSADQVYHTYTVHYIRCCSSLLKYFQKCHKYMRNLHHQCFLTSPDLFYHRCMYVFFRLGHFPLQAVHRSYITKSIIAVFFIVSRRIFLFYQST